MFFGDRSFHQQVNFFFCQNLPCCFLVLVLVSSERVFDEPLVINRPKNHGTEITDKHHCGIYLQLLVYSKECLIVRNKRQGQFFQGNVLYTIMRLQKLAHVSTTDSIFCECAQRFHASLVLFFHFIPALLIDFHQGMAAILQSKKGVLNLVGSDEVVSVHNLLIMLADTHTHFVQFAVHLQGLHTFSSHASALGVPQIGIRSHLATELCLCSVHSDTPHNWNCTIFLYYLSFEVEDN